MDNFIYKNRTLIIILFFALLIRVLFLINHLQNPSYSIQQDNYADYADALLEGGLNTTSFSQFDRRLLPGYPILIAAFTVITGSSVTSGLFISLASSLASIIIIWKLHKHILLTILFAFISPMWIEQSTEVANETVFIFFSLLSIILFFKKKYFITGLLLGFLFDIRMIAICLFTAYLLILIQKKQLKEVVVSMVGFSTFVFFLLIFNLVIFGKEDIIQQFAHGERYGGIRLGLFQIAHDFYRSLEWKQYKIFFSGLFYVIFNLLAIIKLYQFRSVSYFAKFLFYWMLFTLLFIFTFSPYTLLEDFGRYSLASFPACIYGIFLWLRGGKEKDILKISL